MTAKTGIKTPGSKLQTRHESRTQAPPVDLKATARASDVIAVNDVAFGGGVDTGQAA